MITLEQIKNDYAVSFDFINWDDLLKFTINNLEIYNLKLHIDSIAILAQKECLKLAGENADIVYKQTESGTFYFGIDEESITNENNIIK